MEPRITININTDGDLEVWLNSAGRDMLVKELMMLGEKNDHFHFGSRKFDSEVPLQTITYRESDQIIGWGKVLYRLDAWDAEHFPHVLAAGGRDD